MRIVVIIIAFFALGILLGKLRGGDSSPSQPAADADFVGIKIPLAQWPSDSTLHSLDSIPPQEWINESAGPAFNDTADQISKVIADSSPSSSAQGSKPLSLASAASSASSLLVTPASRPTQLQGSTAWLPAFGAKLKAMEEGAPGQKITVLQGEADIQAVLLRVYGVKSKQIPDALIRYSLQRLNPSLDFNALKPGQLVMLPKN